MKILKVDSPPELKVRQVEDLMRKLGITIESNNELFINVDGLHLCIKESGEDFLGQTLPRSFDEERLAIWE